MTALDEPEKLDAMRRGTASMADSKNIQARFRTGIEIEGRPQFIHSMRCRTSL